MSNIDNFLDGDTSKPGASQIDNFLGDSQPPARGFKGWGRDIAATAVKGAIGVPETLVGLADIPTGGAVGKFLENEGGTVGFRPKQAKELVNDWHSDATKAAQQKFQNADGFVDKAVTAIQNPSLIAIPVGESLPIMGLGSVAARGLMAAGARGVSAAAGGVGPSLPGALARTVGEKAAPIVAGGLGEGITMAGSAAEQIRQETPDGRLTPTQSGLALATGALGTAFGIGGGKLASRLGVGDVDTMIAQGSKGMAREFADDAAGAAAKAAANPLVDTAEHSALRSIPASIIKGAISEGFLEELPQSVAEQVLQNIALGKDWSKDVDAAAVMGVLSGGAMGGAAAGFHGYSRPEQPAAGETSTPSSTENATVANQPTTSPGLDRVRQAYAAQLQALQDQEQGDPSVPQTTPPDGAAVLAQQRAQKQAELDAVAAENRAVASPDDEIFQSTRADGQTPIPLQTQDYLAQVRQAVRSGTKFTTQDTVNAVRSAMEDAWLAKNVSNEPVAASSVAPVDAANNAGNDLQSEFDQAGNDLAIAANDARVRTGRILSGLQNIFDAGADNTIQAIVNLNRGLEKIGDPRLDKEEVARVRRMSDSYFGFRGATQAANLPGSGQRAMPDAYADNASLEGRIKERKPSEIMGLDPTKGSLSAGAAIAVDADVAGQAQQAAAMAQAPAANQSQELDPQTQQSLRDELQASQDPRANTQAPDNAFAYTQEDPGQVPQNIDVQGAVQTKPTPTTPPAQNKGSASPSSDATTGADQSWQQRNVSADTAQAGATALAVPPTQQSTDNVTQAPEAQQSSPQQAQAGTAPATNEGLSNAPSPSNNGTQAQSPAGAPAQAETPEQRAQRVASAGQTWDSATPDARKAIASSAQGLNTIQRNNIASKPWSELHPGIKSIVADAMQPKSEPTSTPVATPKVPPNSVKNSVDTTRSTASWVIRNKETGEAMMETFDKKKVEALNTEKYEAVPIVEYLASITSNLRRDSEKLAAAAKSVMVPSTAAPAPAMQAQAAAEAPAANPQAAVTPAKTGKKLSVPEQMRAKVADYLTPGNVVQTGPGTYERIISYTPANEKGDSLRIESEALVKENGAFVPDRREPGKKIHSTHPSTTPQYFKQGPVYRAPAPVEAPMQPDQEAVPTGGYAAAMPVESKQAAPEGKKASDHLGVDSKPISEGGKPFKTREDAGIAKKQQPMLRVVPVNGGFALAPKTEKQLAAEAKSSKRLRQPNTSPAGEPISAHAFIAAEGGLNKSTRNDLGIGDNPRIGNRTLFAASGGLSIEQATEKLIAEQYIPEGASHNDAYALIRKSLTTPQYNSDGIERIAQADQAARHDDYRAVQEDEFKAGWLADLDAAGFTGDDAHTSGYDESSDPIKMEVNALLAQADALGIDTETISLEAHYATQGRPDQDYYEEQRKRLEAAVNQGDGSRSNQADAGANPEQGREAAVNQGRADRGQDAGQQGSTAEQSIQQQGAITKDSSEVRLTELLQAPTKSTGKPAVSFRTQREQNEFKRGYRYAIDGGVKTEQQPGVPAKEQKYHDAFANGFAYGARFLNKQQTRVDTGARSNQVDPQSDSEQRRESAVSRNGEGSVADVGQQGSTAEPILTSPTREEIEDKQDRADAEAKRNESQRLAAEMSAADDENRKRIAKASEAASSTFTLGGDAMDNLTGQKSVFDAPAEQEPKAATPTEVKPAPGYTSADAKSAEDQLAQQLGEIIDKMTAGDVNKIAARYLPDMGLKATVSKTKNKAMLLDFTKVSPFGSAAEIGFKLPDSIRGPLEAKYEGRLTDASELEQKARETKLFERLYQLAAEYERAVAHRERAIANGSKPGSSDFDWSYQGKTMPVDRVIELLKTSVQDTSKSPDYAKVSAMVSKTLPEIFKAVEGEAVANNGRDAFTLSRLNQDTGRMEPVTFERGEYVSVALIGSDSTERGEIDGISQAQREFSVDGRWHPFGAVYKAERPAAPAPKTVPISSVIDAVNKKNGEGLTDADRVFSTKQEAEQALWERINAGTVTPDEFKAGFENWLKNKDAIIAELTAQKKDDLLARISPYMRSRYKSDAKPAIAQALWQDSLGNYALGASVTYGLAKDSYQNAVRRMVDAADSERLKQYADEVKAQQEQMAQRLKDRLKAVEDPKTLDDYQALIQAKAKEAGVNTFREALMLLTPEQRAKYDELAADKSRKDRSYTQDTKQSVRVSGQTVDATIIETKHTQKGHDLFVVQLAERVERGDYDALNASAKKMGGYYSSFRGRGATPGFQFTKKATAEAFVKLANGDSTDAQAAADSRRDAFADDRSQSAAERLTEMADRMDAQADESLNYERKTNTARRASFASAAEDAARSAKAMAKTMRNIAKALATGKAKYLDKIRTKTQIDALQSYVSRAQYEQLKSKYPTYAEQEKRRGQPPDMETADFAEFPQFTAFRSDLASLARQMIAADGTKLMGQRLMKVADDVSDAFTKFAKENSGRLMRYRATNGAPAAFSSQASTQAAIDRSGYRGKAIPFMLKRGEWTIITSPSEAIAQGLWTGDGDKRITLSAEFGAELVEKIGKANRHGAKVSVPWQFESAHDKRNMLARMGIETPAELRAALREFIGLREQAAEADRVNMLERAMVGRKNDGLDFFPTPASVADEMIAAADIQPEMAVLEPSAGMGHIADRIRETGAEPDVIEMASDRQELLKEKGFTVVGSDFMAIEPHSLFTYGDVFKAPDGTVGVMTGSGGMGSGQVMLSLINKDGSINDRQGSWQNREDLIGVSHRGNGSGYDRIIMNPPFSDGRDMAHVQHAYTLLKPGGRIVALMGESAFTNQNKRATEFRAWLEQVGGTDEKLAEGSFLDPSLPVNTGANARMVVIEKPAQEQTPAMSRSRPLHEFTKTAMSQAIKSVEATVRSLTSGMENAPNVVVEFDMNDPAIPDAVRRADKKQRSGGATGTPEGFFHNGTVYLIASKLKTPDDVARVFAHEALGHYGLRGVFGDGLKPILQQIATMRKAEVDAKIKEYGLRGVNSVDRLTAAEEVLAELAQKTPTIGFVTRTIAAIRTWLRANVTGLSALRLSDAEIIRSYILPARNFVERGVNTDSGAVQAAFSRGKNDAMTNSNVVGNQGGRSADDSTPGPVYKDDMPPERDGFVRLYHGGTDPEHGYFTKVPDEYTSSNVFDGFFASTDDMAWGAHGTGGDYFADISENKILSSDTLKYEIPYEDSIDAMKSAMHWLNDEDVDLAYDAVIKDRSHKLDSDDLQRIFRSDNDGEASWEAQRIRGNVAKKLGYDAVEMDDEHGTSYLIVQGVPITRAFSRNESPAPTSDGAQPMFSRSSIQGLKSSALDQINRRETVIAGETGRTYTTEQQAAMRNVGFMVERPSLKERAQALWQDAGKKMAQGIVDQFAPVKEISKDAYALLRLSKGSSGAFETLLKGGKLKLSDGVYDFDDAKKGGVVDALLTPLNGEHHDFLRWVAANRAERLMGEDREHLFTKEDIAALKTLTDGDLSFDFTLKNGIRKGQTTRSRAEAYRDSLATFNAFNKNVMDMAEQSGLIDPESRATWESEFYVPFYRVADEESGGVRGMNIKGSVVRQQAFKHLKGGKQALNNDLLDNTLMNWAHLLDASAKNRAAKATLEAAAQAGAAIEAPRYTLDQIGSSIGKKNGMVWFMDEGKKRHFMVDDPYLLTAVSSLEYAGMNSPIMNALGSFKHALTIGVTASPFFKVRNLIRDSIQVIGSGPIGYNPAKNIAQGWKLTDPKADAYFKLLAGGGTIHFGTMLEGSESKRIQALVESGVDESTILNNDQKVKAFFRKFIEPGISAYNELGNRGEAVNRAALYDQLVKQGKSHAEASLMARDLMDFSMQGSFTTVRFLSQVVPFFNARLQGMYKLGRAAKEDPKRMAYVTGAVAMASLALMAGYGGDDDWKKREDWDRNNFWWFKFGDMAFRIPKPFEIGAIGTLAERSAEYLMDDEMTGKRFRDQVLALLGDNLSMNPIPQAVKPIMDVYANKDSFKGTPIENMGMERLKSEYRFNDRTSMTARATSTALNSVTGLVGKEALSPVQVDHLIRGYFGWLGTFAVSTADTIARTATSQPVQATPDYWRMATGNMVSDLRDAPSRYVSSMYDQSKALEQAYGTWHALRKSGKTEEAAQFLDENRKEITRYPGVQHIKTIEGKMNERIRQIEQSNMDPDAKREAIRSIRVQKEGVAKSLAGAT